MIIIRARFFNDVGFDGYVDIVIFGLNVVVARFCAKGFSVPHRIPCNVYFDDSYRVGDHP